VTVWYLTPKPAVKVTISVLNDAFGEYALVSARMPKQRPIRFIKVSRIGGSQDTPITDVARILIECFGPDVETCENMTATARTALRNAISTTVEGAWIRNWSNEQGPVDFSHPEIIDMERWQFQGNLSLSTAPVLSVPPGS
jgi:hypothetical protein